MKAFKSRPSEDDEELPFPDIEEPKGKPTDKNQPSDYVSTSTKEIPNNRETVLLSGRVGTKDGDKNTPRNNKPFSLGVNNNASVILREDSDYVSTSIKDIGINELSGLSLKEMAQNNGARWVTRYPAISLLRLPISHDEDLSLRPDVVLLDGYFMLYYKKKTARQRLSPSPFYMMVPTALVPTFGCQRFSSYEEFEKKAEVNKTVALVRDFCHISKTMFDLAEKNKGTYVPFGFDMVKYTKEVGCDCLTNELLRGMRKEETIRKQMAMEYAKAYGGKRK